MNNTPSNKGPGTDEPAESPAPGTPQLPHDAGLVDDAERDVSDRPQGDPEVPELGSHDKQRQGTRVSSS